MRIQKTIGGVGVAALCLLSSPVALATDVFILEGIGAVSRGMGGTGVALDTGVAGMMTNPATLSLVNDQRQFLIGLDMVTTDINVTNQATGQSVSSSNHSNNRGPYFAPEIGYMQRVENWTFGIGAFAQGGLGTEYGSSSFLSQATGGTNTGLENSSRLLVLDIPLAASYQVNESLSVGARLDAMWQGLNLNLLLGADQVGSLIMNGRVNGSMLPVLGSIPALQGAHFSFTKNQPIASGVDGWGFTGALGTVYKVTPDTKLGASYTFKNQMSDMEGSATLTAVSGVAGQIAVPGTIKIKNFEMPATFKLGVSHQISPEWLVAMDVSEVFWKTTMKNINVAFTANGGGDLNILLPQDYKNQTILALGTAYKVSPDWTLRGGLRFATQALPADTLFAVIPAIPTKHLTLGFGYAVSKSSMIDFAYSHAFEENMTNTSLPNTSAPIRVSHSQNNAVLSYSLSF